MVVSQEVIDAIIELVAEGYSAKRIAEGLSIDVQTVVKYANGKPKGKMYEAFGECKTLIAWASDKRCRVSFNTLKQRVYVYKWSVERSLSEPARQRKRGKTA